MFEKHYALVSRIILGIVIAFSLKIIPTIFEDIFTIIMSVMCFIIGFVVSRYMDIAKARNNIADVKAVERRK